MGKIISEEGMGKRFRAKVRIRPTAIAKRIVNTQVKAIKKVASSNIAQAAARVGAAYATGGASEAYLQKAKLLKGLVSAKGKVVDDTPQTASSAPEQESIIEKTSDKVVEMMPESFIEEVEEKDESTGRIKKVKKIKPFIKYSIIGGGIGIIGLIALLIKRRK